MRAYVEEHEGLRVQRSLTKSKYKGNEGEGILGWWPLRWSWHIVRACPTTFRLAAQLVNLRELAGDVSLWIDQQLLLCYQGDPGELIDARIRRHSASLIRAAAKAASRYRPATMTTRRTKARSQPPQ